MSGLQGFRTNNRFKLYNDFIFSADRKEAIIIIDPQNTASETLLNTKMLHIIDNAVLNTQTEFNQQISINYFGSADIAVTNANRIKQNSLLSSAISIILILSILIYVFPNTKKLLLIFGSLVFGWLFTLGLLSVLRSEVSLIAIGISSIIIGIAANYPLHFMLHQKHERNIRNVIKDIVVPLTIGDNISILEIYGKFCGDYKQVSAKPKKDDSALITVRFMNEKRMKQALAHKSKIGFAESSISSISKLS